jgi:hypothetical protein
MPACFARAVQAISLCLPLVEFLADKAEKSLSVTCRGGGPGSDVLGVVHYLDSECIRGVRLRVLILDLVKEWAQAWRKVNNEIAAVHMHSTYAAFDTVPQLGRSQGAAQLGGRLGAGDHEQVRLSHLQ